MRGKKIQTEGPEFAWLDRALKKLDFFAGMNIAELEKILEAIELYAFPKNTALFKQGDAGDAMFVVYKGSVGISIKDGFLSFSKSISKLNPGQILGEMALLDSAPRKATAKTLEDSQLFVLLKMDFDHILSQNSDLAFRMQRLAAQRKFELGR